MFAIELKTKLPEGVGHAILLEKEPPIKHFARIIPESEVPKPVRLRQVHGATVHYVRSREEANAYNWAFGDGLITSIPDLAIAVATADCIPTIIAHTENKAIGIIHSSWRSLAAGIIENAIAILVEDVGISTEELVCVMAPGILARDYEVGKEVAEKFPKSIETVGQDKYLLDLPGELRSRLINKGVRDDLIIAPPCSTFSEKWLPSYRREGAKAGRMLTIAWLEPLHRK